MTHLDPGIRFPGESEEYRRERNQLLEAESELRRQIETVAAQRRALPPGGVVPDDYRFEDVSDGREVRFSELFEAGKDTLVIYSFMFPRYSGDTRPGPAEGETAKLPLAETPCASCTSILDSLDGAAPHLDQVINLVVVAKSDPERIRNFARERGWTHLRLLSSRGNTYNRDYNAETPEGEQRSGTCSTSRRKAAPMRRPYRRCATTERRVRAPRRTPPSRGRCTRAALCRRRARLPTSRRLWSSLPA